MICKNCGTSIDDNLNTCPVCGAAAGADTQPTNEAPTMNQAPPQYNQAPPQYNQAPPQYNQAPPQYNQAPPQYNQVPPQYNQMPPQYNQMPQYGPMPYLNGKDKTTMAIVCFLIGGIGIHNFMMGETKKGILKILLCWTGISGIFALIDFIKILTDKYEVNPEGWI